MKVVMGAFNVPHSPCKIILQFLRHANRNRSKTPKAAALVSKQNGQKIPGVYHGLLQHEHSNIEGELSGCLPGQRSVLMETTQLAHTYVVKGPVNDNLYYT